MNLFEIKEPLKIIHPIGGERVTAELFETPTGIYFFDVGWPDASWNPIHFIDGEISGEGPWQVGDSKIEILSKDDPLYQTDFLIWEEYKKAENITRTLAENAFKIALKQ